jgi:hypothetical protein
MKILITQLSPFRKTLSEMMLALRLTTELENHPLSAVRLLAKRIAGLRNPLNMTSAKLPSNQPHDHITTITKPPPAGMHIRQIIIRTT